MDYALVLTLMLTLSVSSCGGGISGSGDGETTKVLINSYTITHFPVSYAAAIPASLIDNPVSHQTPFELTDPVNAVTDNVDMLVNRMLAIGLAQLLQTLLANFNVTDGLAQHLFSLNQDDLLEQPERSHFHRLP